MPHFEPISILSLFEGVEKLFIMYYFPLES
jgi:hypothetical protein